MEIAFFWEQADGRFIPGCRSSLVNEDGVSLLECLLTDDGGHPYMHTIPWLDEGLRRIGLVKDKAEPLSDWSRDEWGAELQGDEVKIYSLHDEDYAEFWKLADFEKILSAWRDFLQTGPTMRGSVTFSVVS